MDIYHSCYFNSAPPTSKAVSVDLISREQGLRYDAGFAVPVLMS